MAENTDDPRFLRSFEALIRAISDLLDERALSEISITDVVRCAGVSRPTFYQHFPDLQTAAKAAALKRLSAAFPPVEPIALAALGTEGIKDDIVARALPIFEHLKAHKDFYLRVRAGVGSLDIFEDLLPFVAHRTVRASRGDAEETDATVFLISGIVGMVVHWMTSDFQGRNRPDQMAVRLANVIDWSRRAPV
ncbi:TetR/AcrR family transcriptional regulator [Asticcacaulis sp. 201]|uniref:TetR/AcrR family transcriptional regulator n=1 Tax=Asticcacaulis sp. 201 TaxID=3028787 RepID=UPI002917036D|nr:TetR family transcriptional regulator [Asticcacaulis sp. 201]MDV6330917.1 TetR family transcriptional regulator [Asticcacaulis sp. 201]